MRTADFDYALPPELIAQQPAVQRDQSRLLVLRRGTGAIEHRQFHDLPDYLRSGDVLVLNNSRVIPARLRGVNAKTGGLFEILLLEENTTNDWWVMLRPGKRARVGTEIQIVSRRRGNESHHKDILETPHVVSCEISATVIETNDEGHRRLRFAGTPDVTATLDELGEVPLPPYIMRDDFPSLEADKERYQTVFADPAGSVAAPTAGLHFTDSLLDEIRSRGVIVGYVTLHVGLATFAPVKAEMVSHHRMHEERYEVSELTARVVSEARLQRRRVIAVGTTTVRVLESALPTKSDGTTKVVAGRNRTRIFIHPPYDFRTVDALLTNFHLPRSTLLMLVSAFAAPGKTSGRETVLATYAEAMRERYRFFSYGDAMLIL